MSYRPEEASAPATAEAYPQTSAFRPGLRFQALLTILLALLTLISVFLLGPANSRSKLLSPAAASGVPPAGATTTATASGATITAPAPALGPPARVLPPARLAAYEGLGAWVSLYDYDLTTHPIDPAAATAAMAHRGVKVLYLQTSRWNLPNALDAPAAAGRLIEAAHRHGIKVVGWYLPGFVDIRHDVAASMGTLTFTTPQGQHFDALAPDIEDFSGVNNNIAAFNAGIVAYSTALRAAAGPAAVLGAIVPDAVNNQRAPGTWGAFPWPQIAQVYDVVLPMGYWSVNKGQCATETDAAGYTKNVVELTATLMGMNKPMVVVGGIGDCNTVSEVTGYAQAAAAEGLLGAGIYSFETVEQNRNAEAMWKALGAGPD